jgi:hypothetical protein
MLNVQVLPESFRRRMSAFFTGSSDRDEGSSSMAANSDGTPSSPNTDGVEMTDLAITNGDDRATFVEFDRDPDQTGAPPASTGTEQEAAHRQSGSNHDERDTVHLAQTAAIFDGEAWTSTIDATTPQSPTPPPPPSILARTTSLPARQSIFTNSGVISCAVEWQSNPLEMASGAQEETTAPFKRV